MKSVKKIKLVTKKALFVFLFIVLTGHYSMAQTMNTTQLQEVVNGSLNYYRKLNPSATIPALNLVVVSTDDWSGKLNKVNWDFEAGYVEGDVVYVTEPVLSEQIAVFPDVESVTRYTIAKEMISKICYNNVPDWFCYGYAAYEARLPRPYKSIQGMHAVNNSFPPLSVLTDFKPESDEDQRNLAFTLAEYCLLVHGDRRLPYTFKNNGEIDPFTPVAVNDTWHLFLEKHYLESKDQIKILKENSRFAIYCASKNQVDAQNYLNDLTSLLNFYENEFKVNITRRVDILINPDRCTQLLVEGWECDSNQGGGGHGNGMAGCALIPYTSYNSSIHLLLHEFTHVYQFWLKSNFMPAWLSEGFAQRLSAIKEIPDPFVTYKTDMFNKWTNVNQNLGRYPSMAELMDYSFVRTNNVDYYTLGALMVEYIIKKSGYQTLRKVVESNGLDFTSMGYNNKEAFLSDFYFYFNVRIMNKDVVDLQSPKTGTLYDTEILDIGWTTSNPEIGVKLEISFDDGKEWQTLADQVNQNAFRWSIPNNTSGEIYLKFSVPENLNVSSVYGPFKVKNSPVASIGLSNPDGGEYFVPSDTALMSWNSTAEKVNILYSTNNGATWTKIVSDFPAASGKYKWQIPATLSKKCLVKIVDSENIDVFDKSKMVFEIGKENNLGGPYKNDKNTIVLLHGEGNFLNQSEFSNNAAFTEGKVSFAENQIPDLGKAFFLDNSNGNAQLTIKHTEKLSLSGNWTMELWFKTVANNPGLQYFIWKPGGGEEYFSNYSLQLNGYWTNELFAFYFSGNDRIGLKNQFYPTLNVWYHIAFIRDVEKNKLSVIIRDSNRNVIQEKSMNDVLGNNPLTSLKDLLIGSNFTGYIDEVRISNIVRESAPDYNTTSQASICANETFMFGNQLLTKSGEYTEVFKSIAGSDSTVVLTLTVNPTYHKTLQKTINEGEVYKFGSRNISVAGEYTESFQSISGCDSIVVLKLTVKQSYHETKQATICEGTTYEFGTQTLSAAGEYTEVFKSIAGSDSTVVLTLAVNPTYHKTLQKTINEGEVFEFGSQTITIAGEYTESFQSISGCDSIVVLKLNVNQSYHETEQATICEGTTYEFGTQTLSATGEYTEVFKSSTGSDSTVVLTLTVNPNLHETLQKTICAGETYLFGTNNLGEPGEYTEVFECSTGCDSIVTLLLSVSTMNVPVIIQEADTLKCDLTGVCSWYCNNELQAGINASQYTVKESGYYQVVVCNEHGCESPMSESLYVTLTSIKDLSFSDRIVMYPNPTISEINIEGLGTSTETNLLIFDSSGRNVYKKKTEATKTAIDISGFTSGTYSLILIQGENKADYKIIKK